MKQLVGEPLLICLVGEFRVIDSLQDLIMVETPFHSQIRHAARSIAGLLWFCLPPAWQRDPAE
jgi:hypothetical protein